MKKDFSCPRSGKLNGQKGPCGCSQETQNPFTGNDCCLQSLETSLIAVGIFFLEECGITSGPLSEATGLACGGDLTTVYDF